MSLNEVRSLIKDHENDEKQISVRSELTDYLKDCYVCRNEESESMACCPDCYNHTCTACCAELKKCPICRKVWRTVFILNMNGPSITIERALKSPNEEFEREFEREFEAKADEISDILANTTVYLLGRDTAERVYPRTHGLSVQPPSPEIWHHRREPEYTSGVPLNMLRANMVSLNIGNRQTPLPGRHATPLAEITQMVSLECMPNALTQRSAIEYMPMLWCGRNGVRNETQPTWPARQSSDEDENPPVRDMLNM